MIKWDIRERTYSSKTQGKERSWQGTRIRWPAISQDGLLRTPPPLVLLLHFQPAELWEKAVQITQPGASYDDTGHLSLLIPKSLWARALQRNRTNWINTGGDVYYVEMTHVISEAGKFKISWAHVPARRLSSKWFSHCKGRSTSCSIQDFDWLDWLTWTASESPWI